MVGWFRPFFRGGTIDPFQCWFPHGTPFGVLFASLFDTVDFGGIEEVRGEFGHAPMSANGAGQGGQGLG